MTDKTAMHYQLVCIMTQPAVIGKAFLKIVPTPLKKE
jgi:hypothetical protein